MAMKILAVADLHGTQYRMNLVLENIRKYSPDVVVLAGDITNFGPSEMATTLLGQIRHVPTLVVRGNCDPTNIKEAVEKADAHFIEQKRYLHQKIPFVGVGGGKIRPFQTKVDQAATTTFYDLIDSATVLVSHVPPYGYQDRVFIGMHGGSKELRELIDQKQPQLVLCGHIHEDAGITKTEHTTIVNCSIGKRGSGALININKDKSVLASMLKD